MDNNIGGKWLIQVFIGPLTDPGKLSPAPAMYMGQPGVRLTRATCGHDAGAPDKNRARCGQGMSCAHLRLIP